MKAAPHDLARILLVKFALEYSNDWFVVPVEVAVGSLCHVRSLIVTNTFGERLLIPHTSQVDGAASPWRIFALTHDAQQLFFLPPVLGPSLESPPVEDVLFLRDEMANVAWGVERVVESAAGRPLDRFEAYQEAAPTRGAQGGRSAWQWTIDGAGRLSSRHQRAGLLDPTPAGSSRHIHALAAGHTAQPRR